MEAEDIKLVHVKKYLRYGRPVRGSIRKRKASDYIKFGKREERLNFGFTGEGPKYSNLPPADFEAKLCPCGEKAIYRAAKRVFCRNHKAAAVYWTKKEFGRYFGRLTDELKRLGEL